MPDKAKKETKKPTKFKRNIHGILGAKEIAKPNTAQGASRNGMDAPTPTSSSDKKK
jgi:hypothetical protein